MSATIRDIKEKTGLSLATISKYLNGGNVLPENRASIEAAIQELHYEVNEIARGLVTNKTKTVGVLVYNVESMFNGSLLRYIGEALRSRGYGMLICDSCEDEKVEAQSLRFLVNKKVDGIIVVPVSDKSEFLIPAKNAGIPIVLLDRALKDAEADCVRIDNRAAARKAVQFLLEKGHRDIAIICSSAEYTGIERWKGYLEVLNEAGIQPKDEMQKKGKHCIEHGYHSMKALLSLPHRPTAVFMTNYEISLGAIMALNESDMHCPHDISLFGFDDLILSQVVEPRLYMVVQPMKEMGEQAVELLLRRISSKSESMPVEIALGTRIMPGNSIKEL